MNVYIDTNIIIDLLTKREPFYEDAYKLFNKLQNNELVGFTSVKSLADIYYIVQRYYHDKQEALKTIVDLISVLYVADNNDIDLLKAMSSKINDFEDSLIDELSFRNHLHYIITRNTKDFKNSKVKAILPKECFEELDNIEIDTNM